MPPKPEDQATQAPLLRLPVLRPGPGALVRPPFLVARPVPPFTVRRALPDRLRVTRPADLVDVTFRFVNLAVQGRGGSFRLARLDGDRPARLILLLPPQHIAEVAFAESSPAGSVNQKDLEYREGATPPGDDPPATPVDTLLAGPSQLVFDVGDAEIDFTLTGLLDAAQRLPLVVGANAPAPASGVRPTLPPVFEVLADRARLRRELRKRGGPLLGAADLPRDPAAWADMRARAVGLEHRFGRAAALSWLAGEQPAARPARAKVRRPPRPADPFVAGVTGIELPFRMLLSPHAGGGFALAAGAPPQAGTVELWHARLGLRPDDPSLPVDEQPSPARTVRAVWTRDKDLRPALAGEPPGTNLPDPFEKGTEPVGAARRLSLNANDRIMAVHQTSDFRLRKGAATWTPRAIPVDRLYLSALGGWLDAGVSWPTQPDLFELEEWRHLATLGRDHYVRVVRAGFLFPFGHRASFVKVTERKFHPAHPGNPAFLRQRFFIVCREPYRAFPSLGGNQDRQLPFSDARVLTLVTPPLDPPQAHPVAGQPALTCFEPAVGGSPFPFRCLVTDRAGNLVELEVPLLFVGKTANDHAGFIEGLVAEYQGGPGTKTVAAPAAGQRVAFVPPGKPGDTELAAHVVRFAARPRTVAAGVDQPRFGPVMASAQASVPAVEQLTGGSGRVDVTWPQAYLDHGLAPAGNAGEVFLKVVTPAGLDFAGKGQRSGALVTPSISIQGLSRAVGPVGVDPAQFAAGSLNPLDLFAGLGSAKLFGAVPLAELIAAVTGEASKAVRQAPSFLTEAVTRAAGLSRDAAELAAALAGLPAPPLADLRTAATSTVSAIGTALGDPGSASVPALQAVVEDLQTAIGAAAAAVAALEPGRKRRVQTLLARLGAAAADAADLAEEIVHWAQGILGAAGVRTRVVWHPAVADWKGIVKFANPDRALTLAVDLASQPGAPEPLVDITCSVEGVTVDLAVVALSIDLIRFQAVAGKKPDIEVRLGDPGVTFAGPLAFVEGLRSLIPLDGFSDPPSLDVSAEGVKAGFSLALPNLAVGIFSLENLALEAQLSVPFVGESLAFRFAFCSRERPFRLIVSMFGGGGFVGIEVTPAGIRTIEASLEFGACVSMEFGVAGGSLSVMAGIYFRFETGKGLLLSGYFRARGEVDVLGLISASIELSISLTWQEPNKVAGRASLTIEVEVLFFSASVEITCEKRFAGSGADPTFAELMAPGADGDPWADYCAAFVGV